MSAAVGGYRVVLRLPGALPAFAWAGVARLGYGVLPLALLLLLSARRGSFAEAAAATTGYGLTAALVGPARARAADRFGAAQVLVACGVLLVAGCAAVVLVARGPLVVLVVVAVVAGATPPPVGPVMRAVWRRLALGDDDAVRAAYALDAVGEEVLFVAGPLVGGVLVAGFGAGPVVVRTAVLLLVAASGMASSAAVRSGPAGVAPTGVAPTGAGASEPRAGALWRTTGFVVGLMPVLGLGLLLGAVELAGVAAVVAVQGERASGWPAAALSAGSLLGGVVYGRRRWPGRTSVQAVVLTVVAGVLVAVAAGAVAAAPGTVVPLLLVLAVTGVAVAPGIVVAYLLADERAPVAGAESTAWVNAAFNLGVAAGGLLAGVLVDAAGVAVALVVGAAVAVVVAVPGVGRSLSVRWGSRR